MPLFRYYLIQVRPVFNSAAIVPYCAAMLKKCAARVICLCDKLVKILKI